MGVKNICNTLKDLYVSCCITFTLKLKKHKQKLNSVVKEMSPEVFKDKVNCYLQFTWKCIKRLDAWMDGTMDRQTHDSKLLIIETGW